MPTVMPRFTLALLCLTAGLALAGCATAVEANLGDDDAGQADHASPGKDGSSGSEGGTGFPDAGAGDAATDDGSVVQDAGPPADASPCAASGTLATYDFTGEPGNQSSTASASAVAGISAGSISRAANLTAVSGANSINASGWSTAGLDKSLYYTFTITPTSSCALDLTSLGIDTKESGTGPASLAVATSADNFASTTTFAINSSTSVALSVSGATKAVEVRVYGYDATGAGGTMRIQTTLTVSGALK